MKNIFLLPAEKPIKSIGDLVKDKYGDIHIFTKNDGKEYGKTTTKLNIYITYDDEEPKKGDWCYDRSVEGGLVRYTELPKHWVDTQKKIILTTDQYLISEGVQSIDDEFLEWFVKNPTREFVMTLPDVRGLRDIFQPTEKDLYKIIIPKEEPKQETLEEAAERLIINPTLEDKQVFKEGAKWQSERMYSEEYLKLAFKHGILFKEESVSTCEEAIEAEFSMLLEQFKKK